MKTVVTITGIRPDFIRMSFVFKQLDKYFNHILVHTGQHYDYSLSEVFFNELNIRKPDFILNTGKETKNHYEQLAYLNVEIPKLFKEKNINPDLIIFLGDSNSAGVSFILKKEGYKICHIEAGMRSYDKRMLEEINRTVCDHCSDLLFVYHEDYKKNLYNENIRQNVFVVGNTITEPLNLFKNTLLKNPKQNNMILLDIHRPENFKHPQRLQKIFKFANNCYSKYNLPVKILYFKRLVDTIEENIDVQNSLQSIQIIPLMNYSTYLDTVYNCRFIISDSGTAQEEPALLNTPVIVPRDYSERPQSYFNNCSMRFDLDNNYDNQAFQWIEDLETGKIVMNTDWLGNGDTSELIINHIKRYLNDK